MSLDGKPSVHGISARANRKACFKVMTRKRSNRTMPGIVPPLTVAVLQSFAESGSGGTFGTVANAVMLTMPGGTR